MSRNNLLTFPLLLLLCLGQTSCLEIFAVGHGGEGQGCKENGTCDQGLSCCTNGICETSCVWEDEITGLMWMNPPEFENMTWTQAKEYCEALSYQELDGWRLPHMGEFRSLVNGCSEVGEDKQCGLEADYTILSREEVYSCFSCDSCDSSPLNCYKSTDLIEAGYYAIYYWSSDLYSDDSNMAWHMGFESRGSAWTREISALGYVRCVRDNL